MTHPSIIEMRGVNKWFGSLQVLKDIDLQVAPGQERRGPRREHAVLADEVGELDRVERASAAVGPRGRPLRDEVKAAIRTALMRPQRETKARLVRP